MRDRRKLTHRVTHLTTTGCLLLTLAFTTSAYTVVLKGGRRVEIPDRFSLTKTTLTYEAGPSILITLQIAAIDVGATERANKEASGSLLARTDNERVLTVEGSREHVANVAVSRAQRSISNRELEPYARMRRESELTYERRQKKLGLPSIEELRARAAAETEAIRKELEQKRSQERDSESYWRSRASELRTEIAAVEAELDYVRSRLDELRSLSSTSSFTVVSSGFPLGPIGRSVVNSQLGNPLGVPFGAPFGVPFGGASATRGFRRTNVFGAPGRAPFGGGHFGGGYGRGRVWINQPGRFLARPFAIAPPVLPLSGLTSFSSPLAGYDSDYNGSDLTARFDELVGTKAALNSRWQELENEARRAGAPPGWLRP